MAWTAATKLPDQQDLQNVLQHYLNVVKNNAAATDMLATNCVLDWFGRSVRGYNKVKQYLRYEVNTQVKHADFNKVELCEAIEVKPSHMATKLTPTIPKCNLICKADSDNATQQQNVSDDIIMEISSPSTSKKEISVASLGIAPLPADDDDVDVNESVEGNWLAKRQKRSSPTPIINEYMQKSTDVEEAITQAPRQDNYSPLYYIETTGKLEPLSECSWERMVRLRISYRQDLTNGNIQYALIIYERLQDNGEVKTLTRRNLNAEFASEEETNIDATAESEMSITLEQRSSTPVNTSVVSNLSDYPALRTPTKMATTPPATPRRRRRDVYINLKRPYASGPMYPSNADTPRKPTKKCNAARTLRL